MYLTIGWLSANDKTLDYEAHEGVNSVDLLTLFSKETTPLVTRVRYHCLCGTTNHEKSQNPQCDNNSQIMVYLFVITLVSGIPVWSIIIRYNLVQVATVHATRFLQTVIVVDVCVHVEQDEICSEPVANIFAVVLPFLVSIFFYSGSLLNDIVNIVGFLLCVPLNFIIPGEWPQFHFVQQFIQRPSGFDMCSLSL